MAAIYFGNYNKAVPPEATTAPTAQKLDAEGNTPAHVEQPNKDNDNEEPGIGEVGIFAPPDGSGLVFSSIDAYEQFKDASRKNDNEGEEELMELGKITMLKSGVRVRVLDYNFYRNLRQVRVLGGKLSGVVVWTPAPWVKRRGN